MGYGNIISYGNTAQPSVYTWCTRRRMHSGVPRIWVAAVRGRLCDALFPAIDGKYNQDAFNNSLLHIMFAGVRAYFGGDAEQPPSVDALSFACTNYAEAVALVEGGALDELCKLLSSSKPKELEDAGTNNAEQQQPCAAMALNKLLRTWGSSCIGSDGVPAALAPALSVYIAQELQKYVASPPDASVPSGLAAAVEVCASISGTVHGGQREQYTKFAAMRQQLATADIHTVLLQLLQFISERPNDAASAAEDKGSRSADASSAAAESTHRPLDDLGSAPSASTSKSALLCLRNLARDPAHRRLLADAGAIAVLLDLAAAPSNASSTMAGEGRAPDDSSLPAATGSEEATLAVEVLINLACLFENKQKMVDAGALAVLVQCVETPNTHQDLAVQEAALSCMGCLTFFFEPAAALAVDVGVLPAIRQLLAAALPLLKPENGGEPASKSWLVCSSNPAEAVVCSAVSSTQPPAKGEAAGSPDGSAAPAEPEAKAAAPRSRWKSTAAFSFAPAAVAAKVDTPATKQAKAAVVSATDLVKNLMLLPSARIALLDAGLLAEQLMECIGMVEVPEDARNAAMQSLRMMCAGGADEEDEEGEEVDGGGGGRGVVGLTTATAASSPATPEGAALAGVDGRAGGGVATTSAVEGTAVETSAGAVDETAVDAGAVDGTVVDASTDTVDISSAVYAGTARAGSATGGASASLSRDVRVELDGQ